MTFSLIVAMCVENNGIGYLNSLPWGRIKADLTRFKTLTTFSSNPSKQNAIIMGRKTFESIPEAVRPLPGRINVVLSRSIKKSESYPNVIFESDFDECLYKLQNNSNVENIFVIGGSEIYQMAIQHPQCLIVHLTEILEPKFQCDTFLSFDFYKFFEKTYTSENFVDNDVTYRFSILKRTQCIKKIDQTNYEELQYLNVMYEIINTGNRRHDRTGTGTLSLFGKKLTFNLQNMTIPLMTTKRVFWRGIELLWMISGSTNSKVLSEKGIKIWDGNSSREFMDKLGFFDRVEGDLGPVYGFQWRHSGAEYKDCFTNYDGAGIDQLNQVINTIKNNPHDRRIIMNSWHAPSVPSMNLPPCHVLAQFYVNNNQLSCTMYQRSCDMGLGFCFNVASYALLTHMIAQCCGLEAYEFIHIIGDCHVYLNHVEPVIQQISRTPRPFPKIEFLRKIDNIDDFTFEDIKLLDYHPYEKIKMKMSV